MPPLQARGSTAAEITTDESDKVMKKDRAYGASTMPIKGGSWFLSPFLTAPDGRRLFFPWGICGPGYAIGSEREYKRLQGRVITFLIIGMGSIPITLRLPDYFACLIFVALIAFYYTWPLRLLRDMQPAAERLSFRESIALQARSQSDRYWSLMAFGAVAFLIVGCWLLASSPRDWLIAVLAIAFSGFGAVSFALMLVARRLGYPTID
jgi:hypothetical protein